MSNIAQVVTDFLADSSLCRYRLLRAMQVYELKDLATLCMAI